MAPGSCTSVVLVYFLQDFRHEPSEVCFVIRVEGEGSVVLSTQGCCQLKGMWTVTGGVSMLFPPLRLLLRLRLLLSLSPTHTLSHTLSHTHSLSHTYSLSHTHSLFLSHRGAVARGVGMLLAALGLLLRLGSLHRVHHLRPMGEVFVINEVPLYVFFRSTRYPRTDGHHSRIRARTALPTSHQT